MLVFLIFLNDLDEGLGSQTIKFADDTKVFCKLSEVQDCENLQKDPISLQKWTQDWQMEFNIHKCKVMHIGRHNLASKYTMMDKQLDIVNEEKELAVHICDDLKPSAHLYLQL